MTDFPNFKGKVYLRNTSEEYKAHSYQYATTSHAEDSFTPSAIVYVEDDEDILKAIAYARQNNIGVAVRSGGHHYLGASSTNGNNIQIDLSGKESDDPQNYVYRQWSIVTEEGSITLGSGLSLIDIDKICVKNGIFFPHGECGTVHVGGHSQTGGVSLITRSFGVMIDYMLRFDIILADGTKRTVERDSTDPLNKDLWFAVLGGSPGNLGIVTSITLRFLKDEDYPKSRGIKMAWPLEQPLLKQLLQVINEINDDKSIDTDFNLSVIAISSEHVSSSDEIPTFDEIMVSQYPHLTGSKVLHWPVPLIWVIGCWTNSGGKDQDDSHVDGIFDRFRNVPDMISFEKMAPFLKDNSLMDGRSHTPISHILKNLTWENPRVMNLAYQMLTFIGKNTSTLSKKTEMGFSFGDWLADIIENIEEPDGIFKNHGVRFGAQVFLLGGPALANPPIKTALSHRDANYWFAFDLFYDPEVPGAREIAKKYRDEIADEMLDKRLNFWEDGKQRRLMLAPVLLHDEKPVLDDAWHLYYDSREVYERVLDIKRKLDPDHIFTSNLFCVGATECERLVNKLPVKMENDLLPI
jgi:FAD/FMN-containing dehydrogenase